MDRNGRVLVHVIELYTGRGKFEFEFLLFALEPLDRQREVQAGGGADDGRVPRVDRAGGPDGVRAEPGGHPDHRAEIAEVARILQQVVRRRSRRAR